MAGEVEVRGAEGRDDFFRGSSGRYFRGAVITDIDVGNFVYHPEPRWLAWLTTRKAREPETFHTWELQLLIAADIAYAESPKRAKQHRKGTAAGIDSRPEPIQVACNISLQQLMYEIDRLRRDQLTIFIRRRNTVDPKVIQSEKFIVPKRIKEN